MKYGVLLYEIGYDGYSIINKDREFYISKNSVGKGIKDKVYYTIDEGSDDEEIHYLKVYYKIRYFETCYYYTYYIHLFKLIETFKNDFVYNDYESYDLNDFKSYVIEINKRGYV